MQGVLHRLTVVVGKEIYREAVAHKAAAAVLVACHGALHCQPRGYALKLHGGHGHHRLNGQRNGVDIHCHAVFQCGDGKGIAARLRRSNRAGSAVLRHVQPQPVALPLIGDVFRRNLCHGIEGDGRACQHHRAVIRYRHVAAHGKGKFGIYHVYKSRLVAHSHFQNGVGGVGRKLDGHFVAVLLQLLYGKTLYVCVFFDHGRLLRLHVEGTGRAALLQCQGAAFLAVYGQPAFRRLPHGKRHPLAYDAEGAVVVVKIHHRFAVEGQKQRAGVAVYHGEAALHLRLYAVAFGIQRGFVTVGVGSYLRGVAVRRGRKQIFVAV